MPTNSKSITVGTTPVLAFAFNSERISWNILFLNASLIVGNTGKIYIGIGKPPTATDGDPNQGVSLLNGTSFGESKRFDKDKVSTLEIWLIASTSGQVVNATEVT